MGLATQFPVGDTADYPGGRGRLAPAQADILGKMAELWAGFVGGQHEGAAWMFETKFSASVPSRALFRKDANRGSVAEERIKPSRPRKENCRMLILSSISSDSAAQEPIRNDVLNDGWLAPVISKVQVEPKWMVSGKPFFQVVFYEFNKDVGAAKSYQSHVSRMTGDFDTSFTCPSGHSCCDKRQNDEECSSGTEPERVSGPVSLSLSRIRGIPVYAKSCLFCVFGAVAGIMVNIGMWKLGRRGQPQGFLWIAGSLICYWAAVGTIFLIG